MGKRKVLRTKLCDMLGIEYPILLAGMGGLAGMGACSKPKLVAAVSNAGGLGVLGATLLPLDQLRDEIREIKSLSDKPFGVDLLLPVGMPSMPSRVSMEELKARLLPAEHVNFVEKLKKEFSIPEAKAGEMTPFTEDFARKQVEVMLEEGVPLFASALGIPEWLIPDAHSGGMKVLGLAGNVRSALRHKEAGVDFIVAQGHEAGGHTGRIGTMALVPQVVDAVSPIPVLAAGGIGDGRGLVAALALGAVGVWVGTAFLFTHEANVPELHRKMMLEATEEDTRVSRIYTGKTLRAVKNPLIEAGEKSGVPPLPMPLQLLLVMDFTQGLIEADRLDLMCQPAGQIVGMLKEIKSAKEVLDEIVEGAIKVLGERFVTEVAIK